MNWLERKCEAVRRSTIRRGAVETVSGYAPLALPGSTGERVRMMTVYGKSVQNGTPAPDAPVSVVGVDGKCRSRGKNLLSGIAYYTQSITESVLFEAGKTYTFSFLSSNCTSWRLIVSAYDLGGNPIHTSSENVNDEYLYGFYQPPSISRVQQGTNKAGNTVSFVCNKTFIGKNFGFWAGDTSVSTVMVNPQLTLTPTATPYAPFASPSIIAHPTLHGIPLASTATDYTYVDSNGVKYAADTWQWREECVWEYVQRVGVKVFDGTETGDKVFVTTGVVGDSIRGFAIKSSAYGAALVNSTVYCSHFYYAPEAGASSTPNTCSQTDAAYGVRFVASTAIVPNKTIAEWNSFLAAQYAAGTPVTVYYQLANPIITQYTHVPWMHTIDASHAGNPLDVAYLDNVDGTTVIPFITASYYKEVIA